MRLDFRILEKYGKSAIACPEKWQADVLLEQMSVQYPRKVSSYREGDTCWYWYKEKTCYATHIYDNESVSMQFSPSQYWESVNYTIVPFEELIVHEDLGDFTPNTAIDDLLK